MESQVIEKLNLKPYIRAADTNLWAMKFTEHNIAHVSRVAKMACKLLSDLKYDDHIIELTEIAGYMHDIGNIVNRKDHAHSGALLAYDILMKHNYPLDDIFIIMSAIGNHDESSSYPVNPVSAALIIADKADVRRSRVRKLNLEEFDIHDRVNYAVSSSVLEVDNVNKTINLNLVLDLEYSSVMDYFSIFSDRMELCKKAAKFLGRDFCLRINDVILKN